MDTFVGDTVTITLNTYYDCTGFTKFFIKYKDPDGDEGKWTAVNQPDDYHVRASPQLNKAGKWKVQAYIWKAGPAYYHGQVAEIEVFDVLADTTTAAPSTAPPTTLFP